MARPRDPFRPPLWSWSYVTFRFADGFTNALVSLAVLLHYGLPLWALAVQAACLNLASVPGSFFWGRVMERSPRRRRWVVLGFAVCAGSLLVMAFLPPFPVFVGAAMLLYFFGVATAPAASTLSIQGLPRAHWAQATSRLSRRTGFAFLTGMATSTWVAFTDHLSFPGAFAAGAVLATGAALLALRFVPPRGRPLPHESGYEADVVRAHARRFERAVYLPLRMIIRPSLADLRKLSAPHRKWPIGY
ncbi:MAG TPA: MFS transporter, partial [Candidatus Thermoplasmatota archaeon]|nr:MFS transporter [Candidatus Thermoplasmatota archaeon]